MAGCGRSCGLSLADPGLLTATLDNVTNPCGDPFGIQNVRSGSLISVASRVALDIASAAARFGSVPGKCVWLRSPRS